jgi:hypothetical protein
MTTLSASVPHLSATLKGGEGLGGAVGHNVTTNAVHVEVAADLADLDAEVVRDIRLDSTRVCAVQHVTQAAPTDRTALTSFSCCFW